MSRNEQKLIWKKKHTHTKITRTVLQSCVSGRSKVYATGDDVEEIPKVKQILVLLEDICTLRMYFFGRNIHTLSAETTGSRLQPMPVFDMPGICRSIWLLGAVWRSSDIIKSDTITGNGNGPENEECTAPLPVLFRSRIRRYYWE